MVLLRKQWLCISVQAVQTFCYLSAFFMLHSMYLALLAVYFYLCFCPGNARSMWYCFSCMGKKGKGYGEPSLAVLAQLFWLLIYTCSFRNGTILREYVRLDI